MINHQFLPFPTQLQDSIEGRLEGNTYRVIDFMTKEIVRFNDYSRHNFKKRFSYRYIGRKLNLHYGNVGRIFHKLQEMGLIKILEKGKNKIGTLIQLIFNPVQSISRTGTTRAYNFSRTGTTNKRKVSIKENNKHDVVSKNNPKSSLITQEEKPSIDSISIASNLPAPPDGVLPHCFKNGLKILQKRNINNLGAALESIKKELVSRSGIKNINGYFTALCKNFDFQNNSPASRWGSQSSLTPTRATVKTAEKTREELARIDKDFQQQEDIGKVYTDLLEKYPDRMEKIIKSVDNSKPGRIAPAFIKPALYVAEYRKRASCKEF